MTEIPDDAPDAVDRLVPIDVARVETGIAGVPVQDLAAYAVVRAARIVASVEPLQRRLAVVASESESDALLRPIVDVGVWALEMALAVTRLARSGVKFAGPAEDQAFVRDLAVKVVEAIRVKSRAVASDGVQLPGSAKELLAILPLDRDSHSIGVEFILLARAVLVLTVNECDALLQVQAGRPADPGDLVAEDGGAADPAPGAALDLITWRTLRTLLDDLQREGRSAAALDRTVVLRLLCEGEVCVSELTSLEINEEPDGEDPDLVLDGRCGVVVGCPSWIVLSTTPRGDGTVVDLVLGDEARASVELSTDPGDPGDGVDSFRVARLTIRCDSDRQAQATCLRVAARVLRDHGEEDVEVDLGDLQGSPRPAAEGRAIGLYGPKAWEALQWILGRGYADAAAVAAEPGN